MLRFSTRRLAALSLLAAAPAAHAQRYSVNALPILQIDLSKPFGIAPGWQLVALQGEPLLNEADGGTLPAAIQLCLRAGASGSCAPVLDSVAAANDDPDSPFQGVHYLEDARVVYPRGENARPLLLVRASGLSSYNGNAAVVTQVIAHDGARFRRVYRQETGRNMNEEVRFIESGPLKGGVISAEPTADAPFAYWVTVHTLTPAYTYRQVLRYRSATLYNDGNPLAVIDSEMPNVQRRLGVWRPAMPLPAPDDCPTPHLVKAALWCD